MHDYLTINLFVINITIILLTETDNISKLIKFKIEILLTLLGKKQNVDM